MQVNPKTVNVGRRPHPSLTTTHSEEKPYGRRPDSGRGGHIPPISPFWESQPPTQALVVGIRSGEKSEDVISRQRGVGTIEGYRRGGSPVSPGGSYVVTKVERGCR